MSEYRKAYVSTVLGKNNSFSLSTKSPVDDRKYASFKIDFQKGRLAITVFTGGPDAERITANFPAITANAIFEMLKTASSFEKGQKMRFQYRDHTFFGGERSAEPRLISELLIGANKEDGDIYIALIDSIKHDLAKIPFSFKMPHTYTLIDENGEQFSERDISILSARAYGQSAQQLFNMMLVTQYNEDDYLTKKQREERQGRGRDDRRDDRRDERRDDSRSSRGRGNNDYQDDDIPF